MKSLLVFIFIGVSTLVPLTAYAQNELSGFSGLLLVVTNENKSCSIDESLIKKSIIREHNSQLVVTEDFTKAGKNVGFLSVRLSGFSAGDKCVINLLYQVKVAVDIAHNGMRTEAAITNRSTIGLIDNSKVNSQLASVLSIWTDELISSVK